MKKERKKGGMSNMTKASFWIPYSLDALILIISMFFDHGNYFPFYSSPWFIAFAIANVFAILNHIFNFLDNWFGWEKDDDKLVGPGS